VIFLGTIGPRQSDIDKVLRQLQAKASRCTVCTKQDRVDTGSTGTSRRRNCSVGWWPRRAFPRRPATGSRPIAALPCNWRGTCARATSPVYVPVVEDEAIRDLVRARADALQDGKAAKARLKAFLLRHDIRYEGRATWGPAHLRWLTKVVCPTPAQQIVFQEYVRAVSEQTERLLYRLAQAGPGLAGASPLTAPACGATRQTSHSLP
jgi:transposase